MKVFIGGSKYLSSLPKAIADKLNEYMENATEILVGDCAGADRLMQEYLNERHYRSVTVYTAEGNPGNNVGSWPIFDTPIHQRLREYIAVHSYEYYYGKDAYMSYHADMGYMVWNGTGKGTFLNILDLLNMGKSVNVYHCGLQKEYQIRSFDDLETLMPPENPKHIRAGEPLQTDQYRQIIEECIQSEEMQKFLIQEPLCKASVISVIRGAPISLERKRELLKVLSGTDDLLWEIFACFREENNHSSMKRLCCGEEPPLVAGRIYRHVAVYSFTYHFHEFDRAVKALQLKERELLYFKEHWFDVDIHDEKVFGSAPFLSLEAATQKLRHMMEIEEWTEDTCCWTSFEKWTPWIDGNMANPYRYYLIRDEIVYFDRNAYNEKEHWWQSAYRGYISSVDLDLPIPFSVGDIVLLNCLPFAPVKYALLLEVDNSDCCGVQMLYRSETGLWFTRALKHGHGWNPYIPVLSPLYRLCSFAGKLPEEENLLKNAQEYLHGDVSKGKKLSQAISPSGISTEQLIALMYKRS